MAKRSGKKKASGNSTPRKKKDAGDAEDGNLFDAPISEGRVVDGLSVGEEDAALIQLAESRYLNYALSVITSRALPDVRDGLKPVQRRILYAMWREGLKATAKHRKCAGVVGTVMRDFHPHGDQAIYDALVRLAQWWMVRETLVEGSGNFGSLDGDPAAAMRYTECRLTAIAGELLTEISEQCVPYRPNYDGQMEEPVVLPARVPNLLVNGATGIAVGMATNIPPHNLGEVCAALIRLIDNPDLTSGQLARTVKGPDFPTGGVILNTPTELTDIYKTGSGSVKIRGSWEVVKAVSGKRASSVTPKIHITEVPYGVNKATLVERIADLVISRKMALITDVRDLSTDDVRIELDLKKDADPQKVMVYLFKHTPLQSNFAVNLTCLIPTENEAVGKPERCDLRTILHHFLTFRMEVVTKRLEHELRGLNRRIHMLEGFMIVFDALDEIIRIIRKSDGKADAAKKIMKRFDELDTDQTEAILELKLYRLAKLEINLIREELEAKRKRSDQIDRLLAEEDAVGRWKIVRDDVDLIHDLYAKGKIGARRTRIEVPDEEPVFNADDFIVAEDQHVLVTADGWVKRQNQIKDPTSTRLREGDRVLCCQVASTKAGFAFFSDRGVCYTARVLDLPATTGFGEPIQKLFKMADGEKIVAAMSMDPRVFKPKDIQVEHEDYCPDIHALAVTSDGYALRFSLEPWVEISTRSGRKFARPSKGARVIGVAPITGHEVILAASRKCRAMVCKADGVNYLSGPGKGVLLIKLGTDDEILGFKASSGERDLLRVVTNRGAEKTISTAKYRTTARGGRGTEIQKNGQIAHVIHDPPEPPKVV